MAAAHRHKLALPRSCVVVLVIGAIAIATLAVLHRSNPDVTTTALRRRLSSSVVLTPGFQFNGSTSDLAQQFYRRHIAGATIEPMATSHSNLPNRIRDRLDVLDLRFEKLPGLLQRALVWDSGYGVDPNPDSEFVKVYTVGGVPMSEIAVSLERFHSRGCTTTNCTDPNGATSFRSNNCTGDQMLPAVFCASDAVTPVYTHTSMWATGGTDDMIPGLYMLRHYWKDPVNDTQYTVFAVHTIVNEMEPPWDNCPSANRFNSLIIPCDAYTPDRAAEKNWKEPQFGAIVQPWLEDFREEERRRKRLVPIVSVCVGGGVLCIAIGLVIFFRRHVMCGRLRSFCGCGKQPGQKDIFNGQYPEGSSLQYALLTPPPPPVVARPPAEAPPPRRGSSSVTLSVDSGSMATSDRITHVLLNDMDLYDKRVAIERIHFRKQLSKGGFGEVWLAELDGQRVAVKRLLQSNRIRLEDVEAFADEIQIMAALHHPNIPKFIGVAWTTLDQLTMVMEYMACGDLQSFLKRHGHGLTWSKEKKIIAIGIARALHYLHSRAPVLIHRDIKSRNILVRDDPLAAKVTDFGVSRSIQRDCMTLGVGTPYWTAPEVLDGTKYSEKSDIYSFGVVLSEIDTCQSPYHDELYGTDSGIHLQPFHILKMVMAGTIQPTFSPKCPRGVRDLAAKCLNVSPAMRPTAREVVKALEQMKCDELMKDSCHISGCFC